MTTAALLDEKVLAYFDANAVIHKGLSRLGDALDRKIPRFVADFLVAHYVEPSNPSPGLTKLHAFLAAHWVDTNERELVKSKIREQGEYALFGFVSVRYDQGADAYWATIPALGDTNIRVDPVLLRQLGDILLAGGAWGTCVVAFDKSTTATKRRHPFYLSRFMPMQIVRIDADAWVEKRECFTAEEWIDLIVTSIGMDPEKLDDETKMIYLMRLVPLVEANVNLVELGPPESGKSYTYRCSSRTFLVSGTDTTLATLFWNKQRRRVGLIGHHDCILFDEITRASLDTKEGAHLVTALMQYMNEGRYGRDGETISSDCSIVFCGNIKTNRAKREVEGFPPHLFAPLPERVRNDDAFLDRIHGFVSGWRVPQIKPDNYAKGYGWMADYLSEVLHQLRTRSYGHIVMEKTRLTGMGTRSQTAVVRIASGLLKLVYPHRTVETILPHELDWALKIAVGLRQRVLDQLAVVSPGEFGSAELAYALV